MSSVFQGRLRYAVVDRRSAAGLEPEVVGGVLSEVSTTQGRGFDVLIWLVCNNLKANRKQFIPTCISSSPSVSLVPSTLWNLWNRSEILNEVEKREKQTL